MFSNFLPNVGAYWSTRTASAPRHNNTNTLWRLGSIFASISARNVSSILVPIWRIVFCQKIYITFVKKNFIFFRNSKHFHVNSKTTNKPTTQHKDQTHLQSKCWLFGRHASLARLPPLESLRSVWCRTDCLNATPPPIIKSSVLVLVLMLLLIFLFVEMNAVVLLTFCQPANLHKSANAFDCNASEGTVRKNVG